MIDTSKMTVHQLKKYLHQRFSEHTTDGQQMAVRLTSFGFRHGIPQDADLVFDVRFLPNPFFRDELRELTGLDEVVQHFVADSGKGMKFKKKFFDLLDYLIPLFQEEGKAYLHIAIGCTGGRHRSVTFTELLQRHLGEKGVQVATTHRDLPH